MNASKLPSYPACRRSHILEHRTLPPARNEKLGIGKLPRYTWMLESWVNTSKIHSMFQDTSYFFVIPCLVFFCSTTAMFFFSALRSNTLGERKTKRKSDSSPKNPKGFQKTPEVQILSPSVSLPKRKQPPKKQVRGC